jgi:hypothetical protein
MISGAVWVTIGEKQMWGSEEMNILKDFLTCVSVVNASSSTVKNNFSWGSKNVRMCAGGSIDIS